MTRSKLRGNLPEPVRRYFHEVARMDPPTDLLDAAVAEIGASRQAHRFAVLPIMGWATAAAVVAGLLIYTLLIPALPEIAGPGESQQPTSPSAVPSSSSADAPGTLSIGDVVVEYRDPPGWQVRQEVGHRVAGFDDFAGRHPGPLTYEGNGAQGEPDAHGLVIADLTGVEFHANDQPPLAQNAAGFFDNLAELNMGSVTQPSYIVGTVEPTELAGWPALSAPVTANTGYAVFEGGPEGHLDLSLNHAQHVIVADVGDSIVLVQIWGANEVELARWLPRAEEFLSSLTLAPAR